MTREEAIRLFGSVTALADAVGVTVGAIGQWKRKLSPIQRDRVIAAALREGKPIPSHWLKREKSA